MAKNHQINALRFHRPIQLLRQFAAPDNHLFNRIGGLALDRVQRIFHAFRKSRVGVVVFTHAQFGVIAGTVDIDIDQG
ncbi:hypothetical protein D3C81_2196300 [compost metagenome]